MKTQTLEYTNGKTKFIGYLAATDGGAGRRPGIVVFPEAFGLGDHAEKSAERLAQLGYVALAADINGEGAMYKDMAQLGPLIQGRSTRSSRVALAGARGIGRTASATGRRRVARRGDRLLLRRNDRARARAQRRFARGDRHLSCRTHRRAARGRRTAFAPKCSSITAPMIRWCRKRSSTTLMTELRRDKVDWQVIFYGNAVHSFTNPEADARQVPALKYDKKADERSWVRHASSVRGSLRLTTRSRRHPADAQQESRCPRKQDARSMISGD